MSETPNLVLPFLAASQAQKHVTLNESLLRLDAVTQLAVASRVLAAPPAEPAEGDRYLVPDGASGDWTGQAGKIAARTDGAWTFPVPRIGWRAWIVDERRLVVLTAAGWEEAHRTSPLFASCELGNVVTCDPSGTWNDFDWPGWTGDHPGRATHIRLMPAAPLILTGLAGGTAARLALLSNTTGAGDGNLVVLADRSEQSSSANRFRFTDCMPRFLMPGETLALLYDAEEAAWVEIGQARFSDRFDVFADTLSAAGLDASLSGAGASSAAAGESWRIATGTTAGGAARWGSPAGSLRLGGGGVLFLARLAVETLSGWPDRFVLRTGLHDAGLGPSPTSGAWWEYDANVASTWRRCTASAAGVTRDSGGFPVGTAAAWLGIFVDPAAAHADFIYSADGRSWQIDGGRHPLAAAASLAFGIDIAKSEGEAERGVLVGFAAVRAAGRHAP